MEIKEPTPGDVLDQFGRWQVKYLPVKTRIDERPYAVCNERGYVSDRFPNLRQAILDAQLRANWDAEDVDLADQMMDEGQETVD